MSVLCRLGWHAWGPWITGMTWRGGDAEAGKARYCSRCGLKQVRVLTP